MSYFTLMHSPLIHRVNSENSCLRVDILVDSSKEYNCMLVHIGILEILLPIKETVIYICHLLLANANRQKLHLS